MIKAAIYARYSPDNIAGIALANDLVLVTNNEQHFQRIEGLELANRLAG